MKNSRYTCLIFDADHTILDYKEDEKKAFSRLFISLNIPFDEGMLDRAHTLSEEAWTEAGLYDVQDERINREYHNLYRSHVRILFSRLFSEYGVAADAEKAAESFLLQLEGKSDPAFGAAETLAALSKKYRLFVATNGLAAIQRGRLSPFGNCFERLFISEEIGHIKPHAPFFADILEKTGAKKEECLMIGDSLSSDVRGAIDFGMGACWFNRLRQPNPTDLRPTYEISDLKELLLFL